MTWIFLKFIRWTRDSLFRCKAVNIIRFNYLLYFIVNVQEMIQHWNVISHSTVETISVIYSEHNPSATVYLYAATVIESRLECIKNLIKMVTHVVLLFVKYLSDIIFWRYNVELNFQIISTKKCIKTTHRFWRNLTEALGKSISIICLNWRKVEVRIYNLRKSLDRS